MAIKKVRDFYRVRNQIYRDAAGFLSQVQGWQTTVLRSAPFAVDLARALLHSGEYPDFPLCSFRVPLPVPDPEKIRRLMEHRILLSELPPYLQVSYASLRYEPRQVKLIYRDCYAVWLTLQAASPLDTHIHMKNIRWVVTDVEYQIQGKTKDKSLLNLREKASLLQSLNGLIAPIDPYESIKVLDERLRRLAIVGALNELRTQAQQLKATSHAVMFRKIDFQKDKSISIEYWSTLPDFPEKPVFCFTVKGSTLDFSHIPMLEDLPPFNPQEVNLSKMTNTAVNLHIHFRLHSILHSYTQFFGEKMEIDGVFPENSVRIMQDTVQIYVFGGWNVCIFINYETGLLHLTVGSSVPRLYPSNLQSLWSEMLQVRTEILCQKLQSVLAVKGLALLAHPLQYQAGYHASLCESTDMDVEETAHFQRFVTIGNVSPPTGHIWSFHLKLKIPISAMNESFDTLGTHLEQYFIIFENQYEVKSCLIPTELHRNLLGNVLKAVEKCERLGALMCFPILALATPEVVHSEQTDVQFNLIRQNESYPVWVGLEKEVIRMKVGDFGCSYGLREQDKQVTVARSSHDSVVSVILDTGNNRLELVFNLSLIFHRKMRVAKLGLERLEQLFDSFRLHRTAIGEPIQASLQILLKKGVKITTLTHEQAVLTFPGTNVTMKTAIERSNKGQKFFYLSVTSQPKLANVNLVECLTFLGHKLQIVDVIEKYSLSSMFQSCLTKALGKYAKEGARVDYNSDSYDSCGFHVVPHDFDQLTLTYMKTYAVRFTVVSECGFEVVEPGHWNPQISVLDKFVDMLHHCYSRTVSKDQEYVNLKNTVDTHNPKRPQLLTLHRPDYVTESLLLILEFMNLQHILKKTKEVSLQTLKSLYGIQTNTAITSRAIDLTVNLQDSRLVSLSTCRWIARLETSRGEMPLLLRLSFVLQGGPGPCNKSLLAFFENSVKRRSMVQPNYLVGWFQVLLMPLQVVEMFVELMELSELDIRFDALQVVSSEEVTFAVRHKSKVLRVLVQPNSQLCHVLSLQYRLSEFAGLLPSLFLSP